MPEVTNAEVKTETKVEAPKTEVKEAPKEQVVDLSTKVKVGDKTYTISELAARAEKGETLEKSTKAMFDGNRALEERKEGIKVSLSAIGMGEADIEAYLKQAFPENQQVDPNVRKQEETDKKVQQLEGMLQQQRLQVLSDTLDSKLDGVLDNDKQVGLFLKVAKDMGGPEQVERAKANIRRQLRLATINKLQEKRAESGETVDKSWIGPSVIEALPGVLETVGGAVIGDPNKIGRAAETDTGMSELVRAKPLPPPDVKTLGSNFAKVDAASEAWLTDSFMRLAAKTESGNVSRV